MRGIIEAVQLHSDAQMLSLHPPCFQKLTPRLLSILLPALCATSAIAQFDPLSDAAPSIGVSSSAEFLPVRDAFTPSLYWQGDKLQMQWYLAPGYYLYREQFDLVYESGTKPAAVYPAGVFKTDEFFGRELEVYFDHLDIEIEATAENENFYVRFQGCAEAGYCYPPEWTAFEIMPASKSAGDLGFVDGPAIMSSSSSTPDITAQTDSIAPPVTLLVGALAGLVTLIAVVWGFVAKSGKSQ